MSVSEVLKVICDNKAPLNSRRYAMSVLINWLDLETNSGSRQFRSLDEDKWAVRNFVRNPPLFGDYDLDELWRYLRDLWNSVYLVEGKGIPKALSRARVYLCYPGSSTKLTIQQFRQQPEKPFS